MTQSVIKRTTRYRSFRKFQTLAAAFVFTFPCMAQKIATLEVTLDKEPLGLDIPVQVNLSAITHFPDSSLALVEVQGKKRTPVNFQIEEGQERNGNRVKRPVARKYSLPHSVAKSF